MRFAISLISLLFSVSIFAKQDTASTTFLINNELVVTSGRYLDLSVERPEHISSIDLNDIIFLMPRTSPEALLQLPGVFLQKN